MTSASVLNETQETTALNEADHFAEATAQVSDIPTECYKHVGGGSAIFLFG